MGSQRRPAPAAPGARTACSRSHTMSYLRPPQPLRALAAGSKHLPEWATAADVLAAPSCRSIAAPQRPWPHGAVGTRSSGRHAADEAPSAGSQRMRKAAWAHFEEAGGPLRSTPCMTSAKKSWRGAPAGGAARTSARTGEKRGACVQRSATSSATTRALHTAAHA